MTILTQQGLPGDGDQSLADSSLPSQRDPQGQDRLAPMPSGLPTSCVLLICAATEQALPVILQLRELSRFRYLAHQAGRGLQAQDPLCILDRVFPEYETLFSSVFLKSSRALLKEAVSAQEIADFDLAELIDLLHKASRGRFGQPKAEAIQNAARQSVGVGFLIAAIRVSRCVVLLHQIDLLQDQIPLTRCYPSPNLMDQIPQFITSIPGIGPVTGAAILGEIGDVHRFDSVKR